MNRTHKEYEVGKEQEKHIIFILFRYISIYFVGGKVIIATSSFSRNSLSSFTIRNRYCLCKRKATIKISESKRNPNKLFFCCANYNYFQWYEDNDYEVNSRRGESHLTFKNVEVVHQNSTRTFLIMINLMLVAIYVLVQIVKSIG